VNFILSTNCAVVSALQSQVVFMMYGCMAQTQPVTIPVSCLGGMNSEGPLKSESVVAGASDEGDAVNDDCVASSSVEVSHSIQIDERKEEKEDACSLVDSHTSVVAGNEEREDISAHIDSYTSVAAGKHMVAHNMSFALCALYLFSKSVF